MRNPLKRPESFQLSGRGLYLFKKIFTKILVYVLKICEHCNDFNLFAEFINAAGCKLLAR